MLRPKEAKHAIYLLVFDLLVEMKVIDKQRVSHLNIWLSL
jgi:hypothetical protein